MFSEWLEDRPSDLASNWVASASPVGKRCLVVAAEGNTSAYNKAGKLIAKHSSRLPGGCKETKSDATMLDCIYSDPLRTYFVLDCLEWKCHPIVDSDVIMMKAHLQFSEIEISSILFYLTTITTTKTKRQNSDSTGSNASWTSAPE